ncbi:MAG: hypothetical protein CFE21_11350 [Bacteroidetes bacterium B1(2017)]|nr:MAG: hypothetical protein CFE21_11350 [Bacteroidetes bacterium B1(2017)]
MKNSSTNHLMQMSTADGLIKKFETFGKNFNPPSAEISLQALKDNLALNQKIAQDILVCSNLFANHQKAKNKIINEIGTKVHHIQLLLKALGLDEETMERVKSISNNFKSTQKKGHERVAATVNTEANASNPASEKSKTPRAAEKFAERKVEWLEQLVNYLTLIPSYKPNEAELSIKGLKAYIDNAKTTIVLWHDEMENLRTLRIKRNNQLKSKETGMITLCRKAIYYAQTVYPPTSNEGLELSNFSFKRI